MNINRLINKFYKIAAIPTYNRCRKCKSGDPNLERDLKDLCYQCYDPYNKDEQLDDLEPKEMVYSDKESIDGKFPKLKRLLNLSRKMEFLKIPRSL